MDEKLAAALARIDAENAQDPRREGDEPFEIAYARRMSEWLQRLAPDASEPLELAARAQHLARWRIPRADYPEGRAGYKRWRTDCGRMHADRAGQILEEVGYGADEVERVRDLLMKKRLAVDPEVQALEDVACLVFLEHYLDDFARKHEHDKLVDIIRKTWKKMSPRAHAAALELASRLPAELAAVVTEAISGSAPADAQVARAGDRSDR